MAVNTTFDIVIRYSGDPQYQAVFDNAAHIWQEIITADIPDVVSPTFGFVDDLLIDASVVAIDGPGNILGQAGPDEVRLPSYLPDHGIMQFDSADVASMVSSGIFTEVILHEMGHVLGLGSVWSYKGLISGSNYVGTNALAEYRTLSGNPGATFVPLETGGGPGTAGSHWSEQVFNNELMTGYIAGAGNPISRVTIGSLRDIGYTVDLGAADPYALPGHAVTDDLSGTARTTGQIAVGGASFGRIEVAGDRDWFRVQLTAGTTYAIKLEGATSGNGTLSDPYLRLYDGDGHLLAQNDDFFVLDSQITFAAVISGTYYVGAGGFGDGSTGTYKASVVATATNHAPTITSDGGGDTAVVSVVENTAAVTTVTATDVDAGNTVTYAITGGADQAKFQINSMTGVLSFVTAPDFETPTDTDHNNSYVVQVRAIDNGSPTAADFQTITVNVIDVNERPPGSLPSPNDGNGDGKSDILWRNDNGTTNVWQMNGTFVNAVVPLNTVGASWHAQDRGDFDGDGTADILWRDNAGTTAIWEMNGAQITAGFNLGVIGAPWQVQALGDFDGDGKSDILWRQSASGQTSVWEMIGGQIKTGFDLGMIGPTWHVADVADFDGDGKADILWRHDSGLTALWEMNGAQIKAGFDLGTIDPTWKIADAGDFDGDGKADILWRHDSGLTAIWEMNGGQIKTGVNLGTISPTWHVQDTRDFNGDGKADILMQNASGDTVVWEMNGGQILAGVDLGVMAASWHIVNDHIII